MPDKIILELSGATGRICEMVTASTVIDVPAHPSIDIDTITRDDNDPRFVIVEVIRAGISHVNRRRYTNPIIREINDMVVGKQGFFGHPDPSKYGFEFREPQCIFVGSTVDTMVDGIERCIAKAYLFKTSPLREWVPKSIAANNPMTVSINATGDVINNGDILDVLHISRLESIDWANPGTEGMGTSKAISIVTELQNTGGNSMDAKEIIKNATVTEFKAYNPDGFNAILKSASLQELQSQNPDLFKQIQESGRITEMQLAINGESKMVKIAEMQGIISGYEGTIATLNSENTNLKLTEFKNGKIAALVPENLRGSIAKRVTGSTEKEIEDSINAEITYVREMGGMTNLPAPQQGTTGTTEEVKTSVATMFGAKIK